MQRLEIKIDRISHENTVPKQEDKNLKVVEISETNDLEKQREI